MKMTSYVLLRSVLLPLCFSGLQFVRSESPPFASNVDTSAGVIPSAQSATALSREDYVLQRNELRLEFKNQKQEILDSFSDEAKPLKNQMKSLLKEIKGRLRVFKRMMLKEGKLARGGVGAGGGSNESTSEFSSLDILTTLLQNVTARLDLLVSEFRTQVSEPYSERLRGMMEAFKEAKTKLKAQYRAVSGQKGKKGKRKNDGSGKRGKPKRVNNREGQNEEGALED